MADGDRPIVLVPLATARKAARRAGVTLNLSADDITLAGKWRHGWIPLDAVASAVKAKRYHGGGGEGRTVKGKGRAGSAVESRREPSRGRIKSAVAGGRGRMTDHESVLTERNSFGKHRGSYDLGVSDAHHFQARHDLVKEKLGPDAHRAYSAGHARVGPVDATRLPNGEKMGGSNDHLTSLGQRNAIFRKQGLPEQEPGENKADHGRRVAKVIDERGRKAHADYSARQRAADDRLLSTAPGATGEAARARLQQASGGPRREPHISAEPMKDGRHKLTDSKSGESVKAVHLASFDSQGHTITGVRGGLMHTRDDYGKAHVYDPATGRAATSGLEGKSAGSMTAVERARAAEVMHGTGSKQHRKALATARAQQVARDRTRRVEAARGEPKLADLSEADLQSLISRYGEKSVQADAARAEMLRRSGGEHRQGPGGVARLADPKAYDKGKAGGNDLAEMAKLRTDAELRRLADRSPGTAEGRAAKAELRRRARRAK